MLRSHVVRAIAIVLCFASPALALDVVGTFDTPGIASDVERANGLVYLADGTAGIRIFDVSVPAAPVQLGSYDTPGNGARISVDGSRIYVADGFLGIRILDATDASAPVSLGVLATGGLVDDVLARGDLVYAVDRFAGFLVVDVSNPAAPAVVGSLPSLTNYRSIFRRGDVAYITHSGVVGQSIDIANPTAPAVIGDWSGNVGKFESDGSVYRNDGGRVSVSGTQFTTSARAAAIDFEVFDRFVVTASDTDVELWDFSGPFEPDATRLSSVSTRSFRGAPRGRRPDR
jgi:hypothetical protein